VLDSNIPIGK